MKILMATMGLDIGGAETHIVELAKELKAEGHDIVVASNGGVYVPEIVAAGIRHYQVPMHRRDAGCMLRSRKLLKEIIRTERPDVVHAHARIPAFLCGTLQRTMKFPFVTTAHWVFTTKGGLRYLTNWGQRTVAVSDDIKAYLIREYGVPEEHISVTINGIDTEKFSPQTSGQSVVEEFGLDRSRPVVSYVSRMDEDRALVARQLIQIAEELDRTVPGVQLLIAGGGNVFRELKEQAEAVNARMGRTCVVMTGPRTDINQIVAAGDIFVGVSRSALEAMSAAKPVIVAGNEGYQGLFGPEKLEEARLGNFCCRGLPMSTPERLLADMAAVLSLSPEQKAAAGAYGREVIFQYYSVRRMAADCLAMYEQVRRRKYQVVMSGYYGFSNAGDDAILEAIHQSILEASGEVGVTVLSNDPRETQRHYGMNAIPRFRFWKVFGALRRCDALLSGGGSLLQDRTSTRSLLYYLSIVRCAEWMGKPVMLYANGIGPVQKPANRRRVKRAVERAALVTLRDHSSARELVEMGVDVEEQDDAVLVRRSGPITRTNVKTMPYPGFPTDMQPQIAAVLCLAQGTSVLTEGVWDNRYRYVDEFRRMGAKIQVDGKVAVIEGVPQLTGAPVNACDLRAGAAMVIAGLAAQGITEVGDIHHIERGYEDLVGKLSGVGANIKMITVPDEDAKSQVG